MPVLREITIVVSEHSRVTLEELVVVWGHTVEFWKHIVAIGNIRRFGRRGSFRYPAGDVIRVYDELHDPDLPSDDFLKDLARSRTRERRERRKQSSPAETDADADDSG